MILSQVQEIVTRAVDEPLPRLDVVAFHDGQEIPSWVLARMIDAATRGYITPVGEKILLIPASAFAQAKKDSIQAIRDHARRKKMRVAKNPIPGPSVKKSQCYSLTCYLPPSRPSEPKKDVQRPHGLRASGTRFGYGSRVPKGTDIMGGKV